jgi:quercetin dioxygenase-like cupin family protein
MELDVAHAIVLGPGEGEVIVDTDKRSLRIKAGAAAIAVTETRHESGELGADSHIHRRHTDAFYVIKGTVLFELGPDGKPVQAAAGSFIAAPPGLVHGFRNESPDRTHFLNFHAPSERFHDYLRAMRDDEDADWFDQWDPPPDGGRPFSDAVVFGPGEGELIRVGASSVLLKSTGEKTDGRLFLSDTTVEAGFPGPRLHVHRELHDLFYVLEGTLTLRVGEESAQVGPGTFACCPPGTAHTFSNEDGAAPVRFLNFNTPAGWENCMRDLGAAFAGEDPPTPEEIGKITARYDYEVVTP